MAEQLKQLFSNDKADELISTISNKAKLDVYQGSGNASKVMLVDATGNLVPGYGGLSPALKDAFIDIFRHVAYTDDGALAQFNTLVSALNGETWSGNLFGDDFSGYTLYPSETAGSQYAPTISDDLITFKQLTDEETKKYTHGIYSPYVSSQEYLNKTLRIQVTGYSPDWDGQIVTGNVTPWKHMSLAFQLMAANRTTRLAWKTFGPLSFTPKTSTYTFDITINSDCFNNPGVTIPADSFLMLALTQNVPYSVYFTSVKLFEV